MEKTRSLSAGAKAGRLIDAICVMPGLVPGIHAVNGPVGLRTPTRSYRAGGVYSWNRFERPGVDGRDKPGHDGTSGALIASGRGAS